MTRREHARTLIRRNIPVENLGLHKEAGAVGDLLMKLLRYGKKPLGEVGTDIASRAGGPQVKDWGQELARQFRWARQTGGRGLTPGAIRPGTGIATFAGKHIDKTTDAAKALAKNRTAQVGTAAVVGGYGAKKGIEKLMGDETTKTGPATEEELREHVRRRDARRQVEGATKPSASADIKNEALAAAGGGVVGGVAGYSLADKLGIDRTTGAIGGGLATAVAAALLANRLKK